MSTGITQTINAFNAMVGKQGGGFHLRDGGTYPEASSTYTSAIRYPDGYKPLSISIYNFSTGNDAPGKKATDKEEVTLTLMVNPETIQIGQVHISNSSYTRQGWVSTLWGRQQTTISAAGSSAGFYVDNRGAANTPGGLVNSNRRDSIGFINLQTLVAMYKNNAEYYLGKTDQTLFLDGTSRVINVMDSIKLSYDGTEYIGSFNTFTIDETAEKPYRIEYNFEFVVSGIRGDILEGHLRRDGNDKINSVRVKIQGQNMRFMDTVLMSVEELNADFKISNVPLYKKGDEYYTHSELTAEQKYYADPANVGEWVITVDPDTVRITQGGRDTGSVEPDHIGKIDYRTGSGDILSLTAGEVVNVVSGGSDPGASHYVVVKSKIVEDGKEKEVYIRYYHMDPSSIEDLKKRYDNGEKIAIKIGDKIGHEGTDGLKFPPHCDLEVKEIPKGLNGYSYNEAKRIEASGVFYSGIDALKALKEPDYKNKPQHKHGEKTKV